MRTISAAVISASLCASSLCAQGTTWGAGVAVGQLKFSDGGTESAFGATLSARMNNWVDFSVNPTWARATSAATATVPARTVSGLTDLPVSVGISHGIEGGLSPSFGISLGVTLPTGDETGLGSGQAAFGLSGSAGIAPTEDNWLSVGAGRSLSNGYSAALASSASTSVAFSAGTRAGPVRLSGSLSGDIGTVTPGYEPARSLAGGMSLPVTGALSMNLDGSVGLSTGSPKWALSFGFGTTPSGVVAAAAAPYQRLNKAFGAGAKVKAKPVKP